MLPSAAMEFLGRWPLGGTMCQVHNSLDVSMCTVSILHLLLISWDRFEAIVVRPLRYTASATRPRSLGLICLCWLTGLLTGLLPVLTGLYTTEVHMTHALRHPEECEFKVNKVFSVLASLVSFFCPAAFMVYAYIRYHSLHSIRIIKYQQIFIGRKSCSMIFDTNY